MNIKVYKNSDLIKKICIAAVCLALAMVLPFATGAIPEIGGMLCPMHIPALLSGALLGPFFGSFVAFISPIIRGLIFGSPILFPRGIAMAFELFAYAFTFGALSKIFPKKIGFTYVSLFVSMLVGRIFGGIIKILLLTFGALSEYSWALFFTGYFVETIPGVVLQFLIIPPLLHALKRAKIAE